MKTKLAILVMGLLLMGSSAFAADGDLIVNGNIGVGTNTPTQKVDVNGNIKATGVCIGANCTTTLHVSGGLYGYCIEGHYAGHDPWYLVDCAGAKSPAYCANTSSCACPAGYTKMLISSTDFISVCYKN